MTEQTTISNTPKRGKFQRLFPILLLGVMLFLLPYIVDGSVPVREPLKIQERAQPKQSKDGKSPPVMQLETIAELPRVLKKDKSRIIGKLSSGEYLTLEKAEKLKVDYMDQFLHWEADFEDSHGRTAQKHERPENIKQIRGLLSEVRIS